MKFLFYLGHPAHLHLFRHVMGFLRERGHQTFVVCKSKDILVDLLQEMGIEHYNVQVSERAPSRHATAWALLMRDIAVFRLARRLRPDVMIGTSAEIAHVGKLLGIRSVVVNEDDADIVPLFAKLAYPLADTIVAPSCCRMGGWEDKTVFYEGYHELAYLHPNRFDPDERVGRELGWPDRPYFILRFAKLTAHHDNGREGLADEIAGKLVRYLREHGQVYITSERPLADTLEAFRIRISPNDIHSALYFADMYVGDSQTMAAEAAVMGTPSIRYNDFVGEISYLEELEHVFGLTIGIRTEDQDRLFEAVRDIVSGACDRDGWRRRARTMLESKIDVSAFLASQVEKEGSLAQSN